jgi:HAE1 family hydrophobic/amphiphilic exporter-1/multidrug efflux pump
LVDDSIPEKKVALVITSPGFNASSVNSGFVRISLLQPDERKASQKEVAEKLTKWTSGYSEAKTSVIEQPTIAVNRRGGLPIQYIIQASNFEKLREKIPLFMEEAAKNETFSTTDVNLKFNKPEINVTIDREKAESLGISVLDVAQTLQLSLSGQRFGYFIRNGKQYQVIGQFEKSDRAKPLDLTSMFVKNSRGELIQMDNVVPLKNRVTLPNCIIIIDTCRLQYRQVWLQEKVLAMESKPWTKLRPRS